MARFALGLIGANGEISVLRSFPESPVPPRFVRDESIITKAQRMRRMLKRGESKTQTKVARKMGMNRVRVTQFLNLLRLDRRIQRRLIKTKDENGRIGERQLRRLLRTKAEAQWDGFQKLLNANRRNLAVLTNTKS